MNSSGAHSSSCARLVRVHPQPFFSASLVGNEKHVMARTTQLGTDSVIAEQGIVESLRPR